MHPNHTNRRSQTRLGIGLIALGLLTSPQWAAAADVEADWIAFPSGLWSEPANWSSDPLVPNNASGQTFEARLTPLLSSTITLDLSPVLERFEVGSSAAVVGTGDITVTDEMLWSGGRLTFDGMLHTQGATLVTGNFFGDAKRLRQVLSNLVGNAIKFTEAGHVLVSCLAIRQSPRDTQIEFKVDDSGIGISQQQLEEVFLPFVQVDDSTTRAKGGTGLGLAISKEIVEMMGGQIGVSSREHEGSCFTFSVILRHAPLKRSTLATDTATYDDGAIPGRLAPAPRVLLAKDNLVNQQVALAMLESLGCDVHVVPDGAEACAAVLAGDFDCVFLDWQMPNMDGIEAARAIRHEEARRGRMPARLIALTANVSAADQQRCRDAGMNGFVGKPFTRTDLIAALDETSVAMTESSSSVVRLFDIENDQSKQRQ